jgi:hypothetical protein
MRPFDLPPGFEADALPFGPPPPGLCHQIKKAVCAANGEIWHIEKTDYGLLLRCTAHRRQVRLIVPRPTGCELPEPPHEKGSPCLVFTTLCKLEEWLTAFADPS